MSFDNTLETTEDKIIELEDRLEEKTQNKYIETKEWNIYKI